MQLGRAASKEGPLGHCSPIPLSRPQLPTTVITIHVILKSSVLESDFRSFLYRYNR